MAHWNAGFTQKKQKQMMRDAVEKERQRKIDKPKPLYRDYYSGVSQSGLHQRRLQAEKERKFWILGGVIIGIVAIAGIFGIIWAL